MIGTEDGTISSIPPSTPSRVATAQAQFEALDFNERQQLIQNMGDGKEEDFPSV
jgi:hypothetical protein